MKRLTTKLPENNNINTPYNVSVGVIDVNTATAYCISDVTASSITKSESFKSPISVDSGIIYSYTFDNNNVFNNILESVNTYYASKNSSINKAISDITSDITNTAVKKAEEDFD